MFDNEELKSKNEIPYFKREFGTFKFKDFSFKTKSEKLVYLLFKECIWVRNYFKVSIIEGSKTFLLADKSKNNNFLIEVKNKANSVVVTIYRNLGENMLKGSIIENDIYLLLDTIKGSGYELYEEWVNKNNINRNLENVKYSFDLNNINNFKEFLAEL
jgi:hypothetical protein